MKPHRKFPSYDDVAIKRHHPADPSARRYPSLSDDGLPWFPSDSWLGRFFTVRTIALLVIAGIIAALAFDA